MKKILTGLFAVLIAASTAFAVETAKPAASFDPMYHWFDGTTYLGYLSLSSQQAVCNANTTIDCRQGYNAIDFDEEGREIPVGSVAHPLFKVQ